MNMPPFARAWRHPFLDHAQVGTVQQAPPVAPRAPYVMRRGLGRHATRRSCRRTRGARPHRRRWAPSSHGLHLAPAASSLDARARASVNAATERSTSAVVVAQEQTLIRMTGSPSQTDPPHQHSPDS